MRRVAWRLAFVGMVVSTWHASAWGADAWWLIDAEVGDSLTRFERTQVAKDLRGRLNILVGAIPTQSERARTRVEQRLSELDEDSLATIDRGRFFLSVPYQHYQLVQLLDDAQTQLDCILNPETPIQREMACWGRLAGVYLDENRLQLGLSTLRNRRMVPRDDDMPRVAQDPKVWYADFGRGIVRGILVPYLQPEGTATLDNGGDNG